MKTISDSFELRFVSRAPCADGETDFKGETSTLTTEQRVDYLNEYARTMHAFYPDIDLDNPVVTLAQARERLAAIKPQPQPQARRRIDLNDGWRWVGAGLDRGLPRVSQANTAVSVARQDWRCAITLTLKPGQPHSGWVFTFGAAVQAGWDAQGQFFYTSKGQNCPLPGVETAEQLCFELDFVEHHWNLYVDEELVVDFVPFADPECQYANQIAAPFAAIRSIWGVGYHPQENAFEPYRIQTFIDENFSLPPVMEAWNQVGYDDSSWQTGTLPLVHGGERFAGQDLYLRRAFTVDAVPDYAELYLEALDPGGEVYCNGKLAAFVRDKIWHKADLTALLVPGQNLLAVRVYANHVSEQDKMTHTSTDHDTGWYTGRMHLDLLPEIYLEDTFAWTAALEDGTAHQKVRVEVKARRGMASSKSGEYQLRASLYPWYPKEGPCCATAVWQTLATPGWVETSETELNIEHPRLWTPESPCLYRLHIELLGQDGRVMDDCMLTTGLRTISQEGGIFRLNGQPEFLRAPLLFGARPPLDKIAAWEKCPPAEYYVQEMLMAKSMNANGLRMSVHDTRIGGINDPRICELADQLGLMLIWQTTTWVRVTSATNIDPVELSACIRQVRNHCSIAIWQPGNHPSWKNWNIVMRVYRLLLDTIQPLDPSRLISPSADYRRMKNPRSDDGLKDANGNPCESCDSAWTAPLICRGNMDYILGYGNEWSALREWPHVKPEHLPLYMDATDYISSHLNSQQRAYFNFEHDEIIGQPNWDVYRGKPMYRVKSYERDYDAGSIGRELGFDEWKASQAWQALGAYETICKSRWLDYDGLCWCNLRGGQNTVTYQKCLVDYYGQPKLAYYAHRMAFQNVLACSGNVDMVYGPHDTVPVLVLNLGPARQVRVQVDVLDTTGCVVFTQTYTNVTLSGGRTVTSLPAFTLPVLEEGVYRLHYTVQE